MFVSYCQSQLGGGHVDEECFVDSSAFLVTVIIIIIIIILLYCH